jgi:hypothetical protein
MEINKKKQFKKISFLFITNVFGNQHPYNNVNFAQHTSFLKTWFYTLQKVIYCLLSFIENLWMRCMLLK